MRNLESIQDSLIFTVFSVGLVLMIGVVHFERDINSFWTAESPKPVAASSTPTPLADMVDPQKIYIQAVLNQPENIYNPEVDKLTPTQVILKGGTKFLVGL